MTTKFNVLIPDRLTPPATIEHEILGDIAEITLSVAMHTSEISDDIWESTHAILAWHDLIFDEAVLKKCKNCKTIVRVGVGFDNIDLDAAKRLGIIVCNVPDYGTGEVADQAMAFILSLSRGLPAGSAGVRSGNEFWTWERVGSLYRLDGATLGIIGLGRIGTAVARRAQAFGMNVVFFDPYLPDGMDKALAVTRMNSLTELLTKSDIVSFHTPLTHETRGMADQTFFSTMKPDAIFVNTARGAIVDLDALYHALKSNHIRAAGLDVLPVEPPDRSHPLLKAWIDSEQWIADRLQITPHSAFWSHEAYVEMRSKAAIEARSILLGKPPRNRII